MLSIAETRYYTVLKNRIGLNTTYQTVTLGPLVTLGPMILPAPVKAQYNNAHQPEDVVHQKERINHEAGRHVVLEARYSI